MACEAWCNSFICNHAGCEGCAGANGCYTPPAPPASPPPPPWAPGMCSRTYQACLDGGQCCVSPSDACYLRRGKRFAMCRPLPRDGHCVSDDRWLCPKPRAELAGAVPGTDGMQQFAPTPPPPRPPPPPPCGKPFTQCWDGIGAPRECCGEHFHCYRSHGKKFALCRPYTEDCGEQWLQKKNKQNLPYMDCLDWLVSPPGFPTPRAPPGLPPSPRWPVPSPPPLPPCSASWAACWDAPHERIGCCADPKQACFRREGKRFAMCRPLILDPLHGGCIPAEGWECPPLRSPPPGFPPPRALPAVNLPRARSPIVATSPLATRTPTPAQLAHLERAVVNPTCPGTYKQCESCCQIAGDACFQHSQEGYFRCRPLPADGICHDSQTWLCPQEPSGVLILSGSPWSWVSPTYFHIGGIILVCLAVCMWMWGNKPFNLRLMGFLSRRTRFSRLPSPQIAVAPCKMGRRNAPGHSKRTNAVTGKCPYRSVLSSNLGLKTKITSKTRRREDSSSGGSSNNISVESSEESSEASSEDSSEGSSEDSSADSTDSTSDESTDERVADANSKAPEACKTTPKAMQGGNESRGPKARPGNVPRGREEKNDGGSGGSTDSSEGSTDSSQESTDSSEGSTDSSEGNTDSREVSTDKGSTESSDSTKESVVSKGAKANMRELKSVKRENRIGVKEGDEACDGSDSSSDDTNDSDASDGSNSSETTEDDSERSDDSKRSSSSARGGVGKCVQTAKDNRSADGAHAHVEVEGQHVPLRSLVRLTGLKSRSELNGVLGGIVGRPNSSGRYPVLVSGIAEPISIRKENFVLERRSAPHCAQRPNDRSSVVLPPPLPPAVSPRHQGGDQAAYRMAVEGIGIGSRVRVVKLASNKELNGCVGIVVGEENGSRRVPVALEGNGHPMSFRLVNLELLTTRSMPDRGESSRMGGIGWTDDSMQIYARGATLFGEAPHFHLSQRGAEENEQSLLKLNQTLTSMLESPFFSGAASQVSGAGSFPIQPPLSPTAESGLTLIGNLIGNTQTSQRLIKTMPDGRGQLVLPEEDAFCVFPAAASTQEAVASNPIGDDAYLHEWADRRTAEQL